MNKNECPQHPELVALIRGGTAGEDINAHLAGCDECREIAGVVRELAPLAGRPGDGPPFADLYWRARAQDILGASSRRRWRVVSPLRFFHLVAGIGLIAAALLIAVGQIIVGELGFAGPLMALVTAAAGGHILSSRAPAI